MWVPNQIVVHNDGYLHKLQNILMYALHASCQFNLSSSLGWKYWLTGQLCYFHYLYLWTSCQSIINIALCWNILSATSTATSKLSSLLIISGLRS